MPHGHFSGFIDVCVLQWTLMLSFSVNLPINNLLSGNLTFGKHPVAFENDCPGYF